MSAWFNSIAATVQAAGEVAASTLREAGEMFSDEAMHMRKNIEEEYERTTAQGESGQSVVAPTPLGPRATPTALERVTQVLSPLGDAGGTASGPSESERIVMLPWEVPGLSEETRARMRALSKERSIFLAPPAAGHASFRFDMAASLPLLMEALAVDKHLEKQRHLLVPRQVTEEQFFTNYFHHLHVLARSGSARSDQGASSAGQMEGRAGARSPGGCSYPSSASPVLVSAAASEASDVRDAERDDSVGTGHSRTPSAGSGPGLLPPLATLLAAQTPDRRSAATSGVMSAEEQFECVSNMLLEKARGSQQTTSAARSDPANVATPSDSGVATPAASSGAQAKAGGAGELTPAQALVKAWEQELRAELQL